MILSLFIKGKRTTRVRRLHPDFLPKLDLRNATFDEGWALDGKGDAVYTLIDMKYNVVAVHSNALKRFKK